jgi:hypothetical protein
MFLFFYCACTHVGDGDDPGDVLSFRSRWTSCAEWMNLYTRMVTCAKSQRAYSLVGRVDDEAEDESANELKARGVEVRSLVCVECALSICRLKAGVCSLLRRWREGKRGEVRGGGGRRAEDRGEVFNLKNKCNQSAKCLRR